MAINDFFGNQNVREAYQRKEDALQIVLSGDPSATQAYMLACDEYQALLNQSTLSKLGIKTEVE